MIGSLVQCNFGGQWVNGKVVAHHYEEPKGVRHPYQIQLADDGLIYAPEDSDACIRLRISPPRFVIGAHVQCNYNGSWVKGKVVAHNYEQEGVLHPYQVKLEGGVLIYAPDDADAYIRLDADVYIRLETNALPELLETNVLPELLETNVLPELLAATDLPVNKSTNHEADRRLPMKPKTSGVWKMPSWAMKSKSGPPALNCSCGCDSPHHFLMKDVMMYWRGIVSDKASSAIPLSKRMEGESPKAIMPPEDSVPRLPSLPKTPLRDSKIARHEDSSCEDESTRMEASLLLALLESAQSEWVGPGTKLPTPASETRRPAGAA